MNDLITKIELFDFMDAFFMNEEKFSRITDSAKLSHAFMLKRFLSIKYPIEMQHLNTFTDVSVIDALHAAICNGYKPKWIFTKSGKTVKDDLVEFKDEIEEYCTLHNIEVKSFDILYEIDTQTVLAELKELQKIKEQAVKKKKV